MFGRATCTGEASASHPYETEFSGLLNGLQMLLRDLTTTTQSLEIRRSQNDGYDEANVASTAPRPWHPEFQL